MAQRPSSVTTAPNERLSQLARRHLLIGWLGLLVFLTLGLVLEGLHGLKVDFYLDTRASTRRLMWTLAHAHGTLLSLVQIAFAVSIVRVPSLTEKAASWVSRGLLGGLTLLPLGFLLGGLKLYGGDPGPGIILVPTGALMLLVGVGVFVRALLKNKF
jgi:hypothetical protein